MDPVHAGAICTAYLDRGGKRNLRLAAAFFTLQALTSGHGAVFLTVAVGGLMLYRLALGEPIALRRRLVDLGLPGLLLIAPALLVYLPYRRVKLEMGFRRTFDVWEPTPESFVAARTHFQNWLFSWLPGPSPNETASAYLFPGWLPLFLAGVAIGSYVWTHGRGMRTRTWFGRSWRWQPIAARLLEIAVLVGCVVATIVSSSGPIKLTIGEAVVFTARSALRAWGFAVAALALRLVLRQAVPLSFRSRVDRLRSLWPRWAERTADIAPLADAVLRPADPGQPVDPDGTAGWCLAAHLLAARFQPDSSTRTIRGSHRPRHCRARCDRIRSHCHAADAAQPGVADGGDRRVDGR